MLLRNFFSINKLNVKQVYCVHLSLDQLIRHITNKLMPLNGLQEAFISLYGSISSDAKILNPIFFLLSRGLLKIKPKSWFGSSYIIIKTTTWSLKNYSEKLHKTPVACTFTKESLLSQVSVKTIFCKTLSGHFCTSCYRWQANVEHISPQTVLSIQQEALRFVAKIFCEWNLTMLFIRNIETPP